MNNLKEFSVVLSFNAAIQEYKKGARIKSLYSGRTYIDYKHDGENTKFLLGEINGEWVLVNE